MRPRHGVELLHERGIACLRRRDDVTLSAVSKPVSRPTQSPFRVRRGRSEHVHCTSPSSLNPDDLERRSKCPRRAITRCRRVVGRWRSLAYGDVEAVQTGKHHGLRHLLLWAGHRPCGPCRPSYGGTLITHTGTDDRVAALVYILGAG